ncbi:MAG TPA: Crp/Fnr family transcriptional regulator [Bryobacteraceae bacterium]|jgi:CRP/FNR family transcriptional regulator|nr:Crp/Fnr family transcriptional regulator [Bryobacteraceae bacterium]
MLDVSGPIFYKHQLWGLQRQNSFFDLPEDALIELDRISLSRTFAPGERLFVEGEPIHELMIVSEGAAALTFSTPLGAVMMLGLSERGEVLGLSSALSGHGHEMAADALETTRVSAIRLSDFLGFLERFPSAAINAGTQLSHKVNRAYDKIRMIGPGLSVAQRLAGWLLRMQGNQSQQGGPITIALTHERIAQLLGISRESVTRSLSDLRRRGALEIRGIQYYIRDAEYLRSLISQTESTRTLRKAT